MDRVTIRLPDHVIRAFDEADGTRSALMRRRLTQAVADGELENVPNDLKLLAERERAIEDNRLPRERGKFRQKCYKHYKDAWATGAVTPQDADDRATSWRREAALYGEEYVAFLEAILTWYRENYRKSPRPDFPPAERMVAAADPSAVDLADELAPVVTNALAAGADPDTIRERLGSRVPGEILETAIAEASHEPA